jgi:putative Ca2+/H+ antiporter (TMEM165/GDT1 family)
VALAAEYPSLPAVVAGTTVGMLPARGMVIAKTIGGPAVAVAAIAAGKQGDQW